MAKTVDTASITISDVKENLLENGIDITADVTEVSPGWVEYDATSDLGHRIYVHQVPDLIMKFAGHPELVQHAPLLLGPTAIGKTEAVRQGLYMAASAMGRSLELTELHVSQMGPVDAVGVPRERHGRTYWAPHEIWPTAAAEEATRGYVSAYRRYKQHYLATGEKNYDLLQGSDGETLPWFVHFHDEVTNPSSPQIPHQLFPSWIGDGDGRVMAGHRLVPDFFVILAGNRVQDGTNSINLAASAVTRLNIMEVIPHYGGWLKNYAFREQIYAGQTVTKIHPVIIAYLNKFNRDFAPQDMNERSPMDPFPTPRNWKFISDYFYANDVDAMPDWMLKTIVAGRVGNSSAQQLFTFIQHYRELPDVDKLMRGEKITNFPNKNRPDLQAILGTHMVMKLDESNAKVFMSYLLDDSKFVGEIGAMTMKQLRPAGKLQPLVREWAKPEFSKWVQINKAYVF